MKPLLTRRQKEAELLDRLEQLATTAAAEAAAEIQIRDGEFLDGKAEAYANALALARNWIG